MQNATLASFGYFSSFIFIFFTGSARNGAEFHSLSVKTMDAASVDSYFDLCEFVCTCVCVWECVCGKCVPGVHRKMAINSCRTWPLLFGPHDKQRTSTSFSRQAYLAYPPTKSTQKALKQIVCTVVSTMKRCCHWEDRNAGGEGAKWINLWRTDKTTRTKS